MSEGQDQGIAVRPIVLPKLNFAMEQSGVPLVPLVTIENRRSTPLERGVLHLELEPGLAEPVRLPLPIIEPAASFTREVVDLRLPPGRLREVVDSERAQLVWRLEESGSAVASGRVDVDVMPHDYWPSRLAPPGLLASFVTPSHPIVSQLLLRARERLREATGDAAFEGYQARSPERVRQMVLAIYRTLQALDVTYAEAEPSFEQLGQRIRLPDAILRDRMACCLDVSVFLASCFEKVSLHPLLILIAGHAFPAVWLTDDRFPEGVVEDPARLRNQIALGNILAFDSSTAVFTPRKPMSAAIEVAGQHLVDDASFRYALDVGAVRRDGFRPLPLRATAPPDADASPAPGAEAALSRQILVAAAREKPPAEVVADPAPVPVSARFRRWQDRLLDLTLRNKLLNYRPDGAGSLPLFVPDVSAFEDLLAGDREFDVEPMPVREDRDLRDVRLAAARGIPDEIRRDLVKDLQAGRIRAVCAEGDLVARARNLQRAARLALEEGGANTLFVAIGLLRWRETDADEPRYAPLLLYPARLAGDWNRRRIKLARLPDDPIPNITLIEKLRRDHTIDLGPLAAVEADESGLDIPGALRAARAAIQGKAGWEVLEEAHLGLFTFTKFLMWKDLEENASRFVANDVVRHIAERDYRFVAAGREVTPGELDAAPAAEQPCVLDADSTQMAAIASVLTGRSMVLQGPPGTGKSQTITNLVAAAMARGKSVLFVSEKMAALEVVHRRLEGVGLGDFCLELHSHKSNKKDVLASLGRAFERAERAAAPDWGARSTEVGSLRAELNAYAEALHRPRPIGLTYHEAQARALQLAGEPDLGGRIERAGGWSADDLRRAREAAAELAERGAAVEPVAAHAWQGADPSPWSVLVQDELRAALAGAREALAALASAQAGGAVPAVLDTAWPAVASRVQAHIALARADEARRTALAERWQPALLDRPLSALRARFEKWAGAFVLFAWWFLRGARKEMSALARGPLPPSRQIAADLADAEASLDTRARLDGEGAAIAAALGGAWRPDQGIPALAELAQRARASHAAVAAAEERLARAAGLAPARLASAGADPRARLASVEALAAAQPSFRAWCAYRAAARTAATCGLDAVVAAHARGAVPAARITPACERAILTEVLAAIHRAEPHLATFDGAAHHGRVARFGARDREHIALARTWIQSQLDARLPPPGGAGAADTSEPGLLGRELRKKARHLPIRKLLAALPNLLPRLKPCFLMSPMSVAQYLPADGRRFDLVVFDEASQIGTHDAIGAIARGDQVVIVGDSRQLPPTSFFTRRLDDDDALPDENDQEELESVLEEALAKGLPQQMLGWHYRSRHDSLIEFSNAHFYGGKLHVFPGAERFVDGLGVTFHPVPGAVYHAGSAAEHPRTNPREAAALVAALVDSLRRHPPGTRSFGVVTFGIAQQTLIEDLLDAARARHPEIDGHFGGDEHVFVKNLENVQGDERDEILFSIGYAKDEHGRLRMHFGPLSIAGGERRLNVAITRARCQLRVFSTLQPDEIDLRRTSADGARLLRQFLEFAARHGRRDAVEAAARGHRPASALDADIRAALESMGHEVHPQVGSGAYRVDLGVVHPNRAGVYVLGIETDGPHYASARTARDRDRLRTQVLTALGWTIHRIWTPDWLHDRDGELTRLRRALDEARARPAAPPPTPRPVSPPAPASGPHAASPIPTAVAVDHSSGRSSGRTPAADSKPFRSAAAPSRRTTPVPASVAPPYTFSDLAPYSTDPQSLYAASSTPAVLDRALATVETESPIHVDELARRVIACFGLERLSARSRARLDEAVAHLAAQRQLTVIGDFVWHARHTPSTHATFRGPAADGTQRDASVIAPEELAAAAAYVLTQNLSLSRADLARETARLFGITRLGKNVLAALDAAIDLLAGTGRAGVEGDRVVLRSSPLRESADRPASLPGGKARKVARNHDVLLLQLEPDLGVGTSDLDPLATAVSRVLAAFAADATLRRAGDTWLAFIGDEKPHYEGLSLWVGLSRSVPRSTADLLQAMLEALGSRVLREMGHAGRHGLAPCAYLAEDGFELLVPDDADVVEGEFEPLLVHADGATVRRCKTAD